MSVAPTGVPDLGASSQAGCRLSLRAWRREKNASSLWLRCGGGYFLLSPLYPQDFWSVHQHFLFLKRRREALKFHSGCKIGSAVVLVFRAETMAVWDLMVITGWSECVLSLPLAASTQPCHQACQSENSDTKRRLSGSDGQQALASVGAQRPLLEEMLHDYQSAFKFQ